MPDRNRKAQQTRDAILDAAIELFVNEGFEKTSMDAIALAAQVAKGTLYYHYASKEAMIDAAVERYAQRMEARLRALETDPRLDFKQKMEAFSRTLKAINSETFSRLHHVRYVDIHQKTTAGAVERLSPFLARIIEDGNRAGICHVDYPLEVAEILLAAGYALVDPEVGAKKLPRRLAAMAWLSAAVLGMTPEIFAQVYRPLEGKARSRKKKRETS
jgi:AcrR family transcriptional regulator